ncbi:SGNH/GDSL hydrolase family protein [Psychrobacter okhotskensis]|uniref:SGNH/GDSL hydrolase family protein n=1 Tax=Psychrobacter okhotskensis TaxID=212403 RepID=UPI00156377A0|nr:SGNH/GDSL hydrolase family protein [Psychrobacter okhotskensis]NRD71120.1 SGNH/GDSL hydrolase family protein [Psychrobacter okhotskensis]
MRDSILFVGDSLTENHEGSTYTSTLIKRLSPQYGGMKQFDYLPLTTSHTKMMGYNNQISVSRTRPDTMIHMWGTSDHRWDQSPYKYSPDGKGFFADASDRQQIYVKTKELLKITKVRLFYLKQPNGCTFSFGYSAQVAGHRVLVNTESSTEELAIIEIDAANISEKLVIALDGKGKKFAAYGIQFVDDSEEKGLTYNVFARGGSTLQEHNQLTSIEMYYRCIMPTIAILNLGTNDALRESSQLPAIEFKEQLQIWIDRIRNVCPDIKIFIVEPNKSSIYAIAEKDDKRGLLFPQYAEVRKQIVDENIYIEYIDLPTLIGDYDYFLSKGWMHDVLHPNKQGKLQIANAIYPYLGTDCDNIGYNTIIQEPVTPISFLDVKSEIDGKWTPSARYVIKNQNVKIFSVSRLATT